MLTYVVIAAFVAMSLTMVFGYSRLLRLYHEMGRAQAAVFELATAEHDMAWTRARDRYNRAVEVFPTNVVAAITGFRRTA